MIYTEKECEGRGRGWWGAGNPYEWNILYFSSVCPIYRPLTPLKSNHPSSHAQGIHTPVRLKKKRREQGIVWSELNFSNSSYSGMLSAIEPEWGDEMWKGRLWRMTPDLLSENKEGLLIIPIYCRGRWVLQGEGPSVAKERRRATEGAEIRTR